MGYNVQHSNYSLQYCFAYLKVAVGGWFLNVPTTRKKSLSLCVVTDVDWTHLVII